MTGYVRQSAADIVPTAVVRAAPINNEFNALRDAFNATTGHKHDGTAAEGTYVPLIADSDGKDKVVIDGTNHRIGLFVNVGGTSTEQVRLQDGAVIPVTTNDVDLGSSSIKFKDLHLAGTAAIPIANIGAGNITATDLTVTGTIDVTNTVISNVSTPTLSSHAATKGYVDTAISDLINGAPGTIDTLNEIATALGNDPNFATTMTNALATKLALAGGTMSGNLAMGGNKVTGLGTPTTGSDATNKTYIDTLYGSTAAAAASAAAAATSEANAAASYDQFDDRYLGNKSSAPSLDNDGNTLITGALYFDTTADEMRVWTGSLWKATGSAVNGTSARQVYTATAAQTTFAITYDVGFVDVYLNGVKQVVGDDFTATSGTNIVFASGLTAGDNVDIIAYGAFSVANTYTQAAADIKFAQVTNNLSDLASASTARTNLGLGTAAVMAGPAGTIVGTTDTQALTNKTIAFGSNTLTDVASINTAQTFTGTKTFSGTSSALAMILNDAAEVVTVSATAATGTIAYDITTQSVLFYTSNASGNWTVNSRASSGTSLNTALAIGQSVTAAFLVTQGATAFFNNVVQVDGTASGVTTRWQGGTAPAAGNASSVDVYVYTIVKTASATYSVFASQTRFA